MDYTFDRQKRKVTIRFPDKEVSYWGFRGSSVVQYPTNVREDVSVRLKELGLPEKGDLEIVDYLEKLK